MQNVEVVQYDGGDVPLRDGSLSAATVYLVLMCLTDDLLLALFREIKRVMRPSR